MNILSINTFFPFPTRRGMDIVYLNLLKTQAQKHDVTLVSMRRTGVEDDLLAEIQPYVKGVHLAGGRTRSLARKIADAAKYNALSPLLWRPKSTFYDSAPEMVALVREVSRSQKFDVIEFHHSPCAGLVNHVEGGKKLLYMYDVHSRSAARLAETKRGFGRVAARIEAAKYRSFEPGIAPRFDGVLFGQEEDMRAMASFIREDAVAALMPNIVDTDIFKPGPDAGQSRAVVFVGAMSHRANVDAIMHFQSEMWDNIRARAPDVELWLVGATPPDEIRALHGSRGIKLFSDVPDIKPFVDAAAVYVVPLRIGSGVKVKIMEALAMGKAIVATPVAAEGMGLTSGEDIRICEPGEAFVDAVIDTLNDSGAREALQNHARETAVKRFGFANGRAELDAIYSRLHA